MPLVAVVVAAFCAAGVGVGAAADAGCACAVPASALFLGSPRATINSAAANECCKGCKGVTEKERERESEQRHGELSRHIKCLQKTRNKVSKSEWGRAQREGRGRSVNEPTCSSGEKS